MRKKEKSKAPVFPLLIGVVLVVLLKLVVFDSRSPFQDTIYDALNPDKVQPSLEVVDINKNEESLAALLRKDRDEQGDKYDLFEDIRGGFLDVDLPPPDGARPIAQDDVFVVTSGAGEGEESAVAPAAAAVATKAEVSLPPKKTYAPLASDTPKVRVALIIDDVGVSRKHSLDVIKMDAGLTLAFLPYASGLKEMVKDARARGHELMVHAPMEAMDGHHDLGPHGLRVDMPKDEFIETLNGMLDSFDGSVGMNNHMGSRLTQDKERMSWVMDILRARDLFFIDSKTIHSSIAGDVAQHYGVPFATRHIFLDHDEGLEAVRKQLTALEHDAYQRGYAIAIGHPKKNTLQAIAEWLPALEDKGIELVPASALIRYPKGAEPKVAATVVEKSPAKEAVPVEPKKAPKKIEPKKKAAVQPSPKKKPKVQNKAMEAEHSLALDLLEFDPGEGAPEGFEAKSSKESKSFLERLGLP